MKLEEFKANRERLRKEGRRPPLRTLQEMAEEFGVSQGALANLVHTRGGPAANIRHRSTTVRSVWYEPKALRAWWATVPKK